jgi:hypothetical protein
MEEHYPTSVSHSGLSMRDYGKQVHETFYEVEMYKVLIFLLEQSGI